MHTSKVVAGVAITLLSTVLLTGCITESSKAPETASTGASEVLAGSLVELFEQEKADTDNMFVLEVLDRAIASGSIAQQDYDEAHRLYVECMSDAGYKEKYRQDTNGVWRITPPSLNGDEEVERYMQIGADCSDELAPIEALFTVQQGNPDLLADPAAGAVACLKRAKLVGGDYTVGDFTAEFESGFKNSPFDPNSPEAQSCFSGNGYAVTVEW
ncbi:hypothetical protein [Leucobacter sp. wl10]|uniref:hypothetical protein n=1 Tax=Leucobacter sp. wl10 TaxID=2304677 RepID=UPI0013C2AB5B|nr:hypothetical protein [Leucobacter sp. wl10]